MLLWSNTSQLWQAPTKLPAGSPEKSRSIALFFLFLSKINAFFGVFLETGLDDLSDFAPKSKNLPLEPVKIYKK